MNSILLSTTLGASTVIACPKRKNDIKLKTGKNLNLFLVSAKNKKKKRSFKFKKKQWVNDPLKITTVTSWETMEQLQAFKTNPDRPRGGGPYMSYENITVYQDVPVV